MTHDKFFIPQSLSTKKISSNLSVGTKDDQGKDRWDLLPGEALKEVVKVLSYGATKYEDHNWRRGIRYSRLYGALQRHLHAWYTEGNTNDAEHKYHHLASVICCALFLLTYELRGTYKSFDDRVFAQPDTTNINKVDEA